MQDRNVVPRETGYSVAMISLIAIVIIAAVIALFVWQPWNTAQHGGAFNTTNGSAMSGSSSTTEH